MQIGNKYVTILADIAIKDTTWIKIFFKTG